MQNTCTLRGCGARSGLALGLAVLFSLSLACAAPIPSPEKLLPDDTLLVVTAPDFVKLRESWEKMPQSQLWADPAMKPFRDNFTEKWKEEFVKPLERELDIKCADYTGLLKGQLTFALTQNGWQGGDAPVPGMLLLLDTKDQSSQLKKNLKSLRAKWVEAGKPVKTTKIRDFEFTIVPISSNDVPKTIRKFFPKSSEVRELGDENAPHNANSSSELIIGQVESLLVISSSTQSVEKVVARATGGAEPALAEAAAFQPDQAALFRNAPLYGWLNLKTFIEVLTRNLSAKKDNPEAPNPFDIKPEKIFGAIGLNGLRTLGFSYQPSREGTLLQLSLGVPESARRGVFKILAGQARETRPPAFIPASAVKFQRWRIDGQKAWETLQKIITDISPQGMNGINFLIETANTAAKQKDPSFDFRRNLIANLGDDLISYQKPPRGTSAAELRSPPSLFLLGSPNAELFAAAFKSVMVYGPQQSDSPPEEREFLGRKIYSVPLRAMIGPLGAGAGPGVPQNLTYAAGGGYVAFSSDPAMVEEYLRTSEGQHNALREKAGLPEAAQKVTGPDSSLFGYEDQVETTRSFVEGLRKDSGQNRSPSLASSFMPAGLNLTGTIQSFKDLMDFSLLPPFDSIAKYFNFSVYGGSATADGLTFKVFSPTPPGVKAAGQP